MKYGACVAVTLQHEKMLSRVKALKSVVFQKPVVYKYHRSYPLPLCYIQYAHFGSVRLRCQIPLQFLQIFFLFYAILWITDPTGKAMNSIIPQHRHVVTEYPVNACQKTLGCVLKGNKAQQTNQFPRASGHGVFFNPRGLWFSLLEPLAWRIPEQAE